MPVAFDNLVKTIGSSVSTLACTHPVGLAEGDLLIMWHGFWATAGVTMNTPSGWAAPDIDNQVGPTADRPVIAVFSRIATAAMVAAGSTTFTTSGAVDADSWKCAAIRITGVDPAARIDDAASGAANTPLVTVPSVTVSRANSLIIIGGSSANNRTSVASAGFTERLDTGQDGDGGNALHIYTKDDLIGVGASGTFTYTISSLNNHAHGTLAIAPLLGGGGGIMGGDNPAILQPPRERIERGQKILNPFGTKKRACMCPIGKCSCI